MTPFLISFFNILESISNIFALPYDLLVNIGICHPRNERALTLIFFKASAIKPEDACSPDDSMASISSELPLREILLINNCN